jgi:hypothetical protein
VAGRRRFNGGVMAARQLFGSAHRARRRARLAAALGVPTPAVRVAAARA